MCVCAPGVSGEFPLFLLPLESFTVFTAWPLTLLVVVGHQAGCQFTWSVTSERRRHIPINFISSSFLFVSLLHFAPVTHPAIKYYMKRHFFVLMFVSFKPGSLNFPSSRLKVFVATGTHPEVRFPADNRCVVKSAQKSNLQVKLLYLNITCVSLNVSDIKCTANKSHGSQAVIYLECFNRTISSNIQHFSDNLNLWLLFSFYPIANKIH